MLLKENVETIIQILGIEKGNFIVDKNDNEIPKSAYNHFVIIHTNPSIAEKWNKEMASIDGFNTTIKKAKKSSKKSKQDLSEFEEDALLNEQEVAEEDLLSLGESEVSLEETEGLIHIAHSRKINYSSTSILADNGWFICPIYSGMNGLYPIIHQKLPNKKGYRLYETKVPLVKFKENLFTEDNFKEWNCNSIFILERYFEKEKISEINAASVFVQKRESDSILMLRNVLRNYELAQKSRIRCGNLLLSMILFNTGQNAYVSTKENLTKKDSIDGEIDEEDANEKNMLAEVVKSYDKLNDKLKETKKNKIVDYDKMCEQIVKAIENGDKDKAQTIINKYIDKTKSSDSATIKLEKTFLTMLDLVNQDEEAEALKIAEDYILKKKRTNPDMTIEQAMEETKVLRTKDYIPNYAMYEAITIYKYYCKAEYKAEKILKEVVESTWLYNYASGIQGMGTVATAYILAYLDFHSTVHSSSILRYLGMDQVIVKPKHEPGQEITKEDQTKIVRFLYKSYNNIINRSNLTAAMPLVEENFNLYYRTDVIPSWSKYQLVKKQFEEIKIENESELDDYVEEILETNEDFNKMVNYIWENMNIIEIPTGAEKTTYVVQKRARDKKNDRPTSSYLDSTGRIKFKTSLGYNAKVKSKILFILFNNMRKKKEPYYIKTVFTNFKNRLIQRFISQGKDPNVKPYKGHIDVMARRATMQVFIQDLWIYARRYFGLPLNGEGYNDAKIKGCNHLHNHGIEDPDEI